MGVQNENTTVSGLIILTNRKESKMNDEIQGFARNSLKEGLALCTDAQVHLFKRMYSHDNLDLDIGEVVDNMPEEKLDNAMLQVQRTIDNN